MTIHSRQCVVETRIAGHGVQPAVVAEAIAAEGLELVEEDSLRRSPFRPIFGLAFEDFQGDAEIEAALGLFGLGHHVALKWREVMRQPGHRRGKPAGQPQLARHEVDGERQHRRRQNLLPNRVEQILRRHALLHPFAQRAKEVCLFDVFFAIQRHGVFPSTRINRRLCFSITSGRWPFCYAEA